MSQIPNEVSEYMRRIGQRGGKAKSIAKTISSRINGLKPKKKKTKRHGVGTSHNQNPPGNP